MPSGHPESRGTMSPSHPTQQLLLCGLVLALAACHQRPNPAALTAAGTPAAKEAPATAGARATPTTSAARNDGGAIADDAPAARTSRIEDLFMNRFPGLQVQRTGTGDLSLLLRGRVPLLLIDGLEADPVALLGLVPSTVRRIEVLRNVTDTAMYGSRGVNGVVRVTTR